ncbi:MAG: zinc ribbon domain-containing protein [Lachnospiraceae bacterium]|nr:zinc ribbon domain-containing protein [Lachnospiraceae bacterium]
MFCSNCGQPVTNGDVFCAGCGSKLVVKKVNKQDATFKVGPNWISVGLSVYFIATVLPFFILSVFSVPLEMLSGAATSEVLAALVLFIPIGIVMFVLVLIGIVYFIYSIRIIRISGNSMSIGCLLSKKNYNCQDITGIVCVKIGYFKRNVITIAFRDGKKCSVTRIEKNFVNLARYLLDQLANGEIASDVIEREHVDRLKKSASGIKW